MEKFTRVTAGGVNRSMNFIKAQLSSLELMQSCKARAFFLSKFMMARAISKSRALYRCECRSGRVGCTRPHVRAISGKRVYDKYARVCAFAPRSFFSYSRVHHGQMLRTLAYMQQQQPLTNVRDKSGEAPACFYSRARILLRILIIFSFVR